MTLPRKRLPEQAYSFPVFCGIMPLTKTEEVSAPIPGRLSGVGLESAESLPGSFEKNYTHPRTNQISRFRPSIFIGGGYTTCPDSAFRNTLKFAVHIGCKSHTFDRNPGMVGKRI